MAAYACLYNRPVFRQIAADGQRMSSSQEQLPSSGPRPVHPLRGLSSTRSVYEIPNDDLAGELLIPAMRFSTSVRVMVGFFSSQSFCPLAPGLADFIARDIGPLRLLVSPTLSEEDRIAIRQAVTEPEEIAVAAFQQLLAAAGNSESAIASHTADCLTYLLSTGRLLLRLVLMKAGLFHPKVWLFESEGDLLAVHGSNNLTASGLLYNGEIISVDRPWQDGPSAIARVEALSAMFESYWSNNHLHSVTVGPHVGLLLGDRAKPQRPTPEDFWRAWEEDRRRALAPPLPRREALEVVGQIPSSSPQALSIPEGVVWESGPFRHQGSAVRAWEGNGRTGILSIATGGGKTTSALIGATRLQNSSSRPLLVLILVPSTPLLDQWEREVKLFGAPPVTFGRLAAQARIAALHSVLGSLIHGVARTEVLICTNQLFIGNDPLRGFFRSLPPELDVLLIADEVHNLGAPGFLANSPSEIPYRLGLSATPIRQYDAPGTADLLEFFGDIVFEFGLGEAIKAGCLTPYNYHLHEVRLEREELEVWDELTEKLRRKNFSREETRQDQLDPSIQRLLERRRAVLENARAKLFELDRILTGTPATAVEKTLIYASAKRDPLGRERQITLANRLLNELGVISHQLTYAETGGREASRLLAAFAEGEYQALTCMKVLDEGLDVPATATAYLLASSTVLREWVQRRGRVLRKAPGKLIAAIHDFFVVPPDPDSPSGRAIIESERTRAHEFSRLAENAWDDDGPRTTLEKYS